MPLNSVVSASATERSILDFTEGLVTVTAQSPTTPFTFAVSMSAAGYTAGQATPPFADDGYGDFLHRPSSRRPLFGHEPTLCAACNLTGAEFALITTALGFDASTPLTLDNVSALFRYGWLAHALGLSRAGIPAAVPVSPAWTRSRRSTPAPQPPAEPPVVRFIRLLDVLASRRADHQPGAVPDVEPGHQRHVGAAADRP